MVSTTKIASGGTATSKNQHSSKKTAPPLMPGQRAAQSDPRSERRTEDVAHENGQNRSHDDSYDVPEAQLLPPVVDDQHSQQGDRCVDRSTRIFSRPTRVCCPIDTTRLYGRE